MARPKKDNADYFSHDADMRDDVKIKAVRRKYKHVGYSIWNMLLEHLTNCDFFAYEYNDLNIELLSGDFDIEPTLLKDIINYFIELGLIIKDEDVIYSKKHIERFSGLLLKRKRQTKELSTAKNNNKRVIDVENPQSKVKYSKEKKTEEKIIINNSQFLENCINSIQWIETISMQSQIDIDVTKIYLKHFEEHLITMQEQKETVRDFKQHFSHWIKKQNLSQHRKKVIGRTNQVG